MEKKVQPVLWAEAVLLAVLALAALFPFVYMVLTSCLLYTSDAADEL